MTANDAGDADGGPNTLQNYPVLNTITFVAGNVTIAGTLNSAPLALYRLEFFGNDRLDESGAGEGQHFWASPKLRPTRAGTHRSR